MSNYGNIRLLKKLHQRLQEVLSAIGARSEYMGYGQNSARKPKYPQP